MHFTDEQKLHEVDSAVYLGGTLTKNAGRTEQIHSIMFKALHTCSKFKLFWRKTDRKYKWKLQTYNAIIIAQLTYGLNTLQLTDVMLKRLDAFRMRGMRYITGVDHAYHSGISNDEVIKKVERILNKEEDLNTNWEDFISAQNLAHFRHFEKLSDIIMKRQNALLAHLIREGDEVMMKEVSIGHVLRPKLGTLAADWRRVGGPRQKWIETNLKYYWENTKTSTQIPSNNMRK